MLRSMTAYSHISSECSFGRVLFEIHSINGRSLDIAIYPPKGCLFLDTKIRKIIASKLSRGTIKVYLNFYFDETLPFEINLNVPLVEKLKKTYRQINQQIGKRQNEGLDLSLFIHEEGLFTYEERFSKKGIEEIEKVLKKALDKLISMKKIEGKHLEEDFLLRIKAIEEDLKFIEKNAVKAVHRYKAKLKKRAENGQVKSVELDERMLKEILIYTDKVDITEETVRMRSHLGQFKKIMRKGGRAGKSLEFLAQEMFRESNTMGSKSGDLEITQKVMTIKSELERIKEQVQNVE